jgi:hypothetical protein
MQRISLVILSILLGAVSVGIGMGIFLHKANSDRQHLEQVALDAQSQSREAQALSQRAIQEANAKLKAANDEVAKAKAALKAIEDEHALMAKAEILQEPDPKIKKGWIEAVSLPLGISLRFPPKNVIEENSDSALTISTQTKTDNASTTLAEFRWLQITPYDSRLESELINAMTSTTPVTYAVHGRLFKGIRGLTEAGETYVLQISSLGQRTHLVWGRELGKTARDKNLLSVLATLTFKE